MKSLKIFLFMIFVAAFYSAPVFGSQTPENNLPHYLKEWAKSKKNIRGDELEKWKTISRALFTTDNCSFSKSGTVINGSETETIKIADKEIRFTFHNYVREENKIVYYSPCGKLELSFAEFKLVKKDIISAYQEAVEIAWQTHQDLNRLILDKIAGLNQMTSEELERKLKEKVGESGVTYGELAQINEIQKQDFVVNEFHFGIIEAWGLTWLNTKRILYSPQARLYDYLNDAPLVIIHELIHANPKLQKIPAAWHFDAELSASFLETLNKKSDLLTFLRHGYLNDIRWASHVFFGLDSEKIYDKIIKFRWSTNQIELDEAAFREFEAKIKLIKEELNSAIFNVILPEFYSNQLYWASVNKRFKDDNAYFKIMMSLTYDPTLLSGHHSTMKWVNENSDKIKELAEEAWKETEKDDDEKNELVVKIADFAEIFGITKEQIKSIAERYQRISVKEIKKLFQDQIAKEEEKK